ncbi:MAG: hypothetical protein SF051_00820, partial [Elusimicrobiota bacterium]|nr:hypothetical protein [Elusimicrobiota bacterium]
MTPRRRDLLVVFAAALAARLLFVAFDGRGEAERVGDALDYHSYAVNLLDRGVYENHQDERASRMPGYPLLLAAQYATLGRSPALTQVLQALLGAGTCVLVYLLAAAFSGGALPLAAGLAAALSYDLVQPAARLLTEGPAAFLLALTLWLLSEDRGLRPGRAALAGAAAGGLCLVRPEFLPWSALMAGLAGWRSRWVNGALLLAVSAACVLPWAARNARTLGRPIAATSVGAFNLYGWGVPRTVEERLGGPAWERAPAELSEVEKSDFYAARTKRFFLMEGAYGLVLKALLLNLAFLHYPFSPALDPTFVFLLPLWLYGLWAARRDGRRRALWWTVAYLTPLYCLAGVMIPRHRETYAPVLVVFAAAGFEALSARFGAAAARRAAAGWG